MDAVFNWIMAHPVTFAIGAMTFIEFVPIKINPWKILFKLIRDGLGVSKVEEELTSMKKLLDMNEAKSMRWRILDFGNSCRLGRKHTKEEWDHCITELADYEKHCKDNGVSNGVMREMADYLRKEYHDNLNGNDFL